MVRFLQHHHVRSMNPTDLVCLYTSARLLSFTSRLFYCIIHHTAKLAEAALFNWSLQLTELGRLHEATATALPSKLEWPSAVSRPGVPAAKHDLIFFLLHVHRYSTSLWIILQSWVYQVSFWLPGTLLPVKGISCSKKLSFLSAKQQILL